jgi:hypothetical protein
MMEAPVIGTDLRAFGGDGRSFSYDGGTSRAEVDATLQLSTSGAASVTHESTNWGDSHRYAIADTYEVTGKPSWWRGIRDGAGPIDRIARLVRTSDNLGVVPATGNGHAGTGEQLGTFEFHVDGGIPLLPDIAPNINARLRLELMRNFDGTLMARLTGSHDGFPAYEFYVNGQRIHHYDPVAANKTPNALWGEGDRSVNVDWRTVQGSLTSSSSLAAEPGYYPQRSVSAEASRALWR